MYYQRLLENQPTLASPAYALARKGLSPQHEVVYHDRHKLEI
jgi:hypothetical protein